MIPEDVGPNRDDHSIGCHQCLSCPEDSIDPSGQSEFIVDDMNLNCNGFQPPIFLHGFIGITNVIEVRWRVPFVLSIEMIEHGVNGFTYDGPSLALSSHQAFLSDIPKFL